MIDTLQYVVAQVPLETSILFWCMYIVSGIMIALIIQGGIFKDD